MNIHELVAEMYMYTEIGISQCLETHAIYAPHFAKEVQIANVN